MNTEDQEQHRRGYLRIGELARRTGTSPDLLRAWERRYVLLEPDRTEGGFRLYSAEDVERVARMNALLASGLSAAQAAARARAPDAVETPPPAALPLSLGLERAIERWDEPMAQEAMDRLLATYSVETVLSEAVLPVLRRLGKDWERGLVPVAREHFATHVIRGRLMGLGSGWGRGTGPLAVLACPPGELHDLGLLCFGIALHRMGWRLAYLGSDTPFPEVRRAAERTHAAAVVLASVRPEGFADPDGASATLSERFPVYLGGAGASPEAVEGATLLRGGPVEAAQELARALDR